jgi:hypothetical protein
MLALPPPDAPGQEGPRRRPRPPAPADPYAVAGPDVGDPAPDARLTDPDGGPLQLAALWAERPLVLVLGSYSSPRFRGGAAGLRELAAAFSGGIRAAVLYTIEARPADSEGPYGDDASERAENERAGVQIAQPTDAEARRQAARTARDRLGLSGVAIAVDGMGNEAWKAYGAAPHSAFLIDRGIVVERQARFDAAAMRAAVSAVLEARGAGAPAEER